MKFLQKIILYLIFTDNSDLKRTVVVISIFTILILIPFTINRKKKIKEKRRKGYDKVAGKRKFQENNKEEGKTILKLGVLRTQKMQVQEEIARDQAEELLGSIGRTNGERDTRSKDEKTILEWMNLEIEDKNKPQVFIKKISQNFRIFYKSKTGRDFPIGFADQYLLEDLTHYSEKEYKDMKDEFTYFAWRSYKDGGFTKELSNAEPWCETYKRCLKMQKKKKKRRELKMIKVKSKKSPKKKGVEDEKTMLEWMNLDKKPSDGFMGKELVRDKVTQKFKDLYKKKNKKDFPDGGAADQYILSDKALYTKEEYEDSLYEFTFWFGGDRGETWSETYKKYKN